MERDLIPNPHACSLFFCYELLETNKTNYKDFKDSLDLLDMYYGGEAAIRNQISRLFVHNSLAFFSSLC